MVYDMIRYDSKHKRVLSGVLLAVVIGVGIGLLIGALLFTILLLKNK